MLLLPPSQFGVAFSVAATAMVVIELDVAYGDVEVPIDHVIAVEVAVVMFIEKDEIVDVAASGFWIAQGVLVPLVAAMRVAVWFVGTELPLPSPKIPCEARYVLLTR